MPMSKKRINPERQKPAANSGLTQGRQEPYPYNL
jgi:hypothetical protein